MSKTEDYSFYNRFYGIGRRTLSRIVSKKLCFSGDQIPQTEGPRFILCNHNTDYDFCLLALVSAQPMDFVATESIMRMGPVAKWAALKLKPILHDKGSKGIVTLKAITKRLKQGRSVALFPEGNRSFDGRTGKISDSIGKIATITGATIIIYRLSGGYLTTPRWGKGIRKGKMQGNVVRMLSYDDLLVMSDEEIQKTIEEGLYTDAYEEQAAVPIRYKNSRRAEFIETLLFICPACGSIGTLSSRKNKCICSCGYEMEMDEYGYLTDSNHERVSITEKFDKQKELLQKKLLSENEGPMWQDEVTVTLLNPEHEISEKKKSTLYAYRDSILVGEERLDISHISSIDIVQRNRLSIHVQGWSQHYEILGSKTFNAVKYLLWFERSYS